MSRPVLRLLPAAVLVLGLAVGLRAEPAARTDRHGDPLPDGARARLGTIRFREGAFIASAALAPDGRTLAVASQRGAIVLWDTATGRERQQFQGPQALGSRALAFSPDGTALASVDYNGPIHLRDVATGRELRQFSFGQANDLAFAFSGDGKVLAAAGGNFGQGYAVRAWDVAGGKELARYEPLHNQNVRVAVSPDGKVVATWGFYFNRTPGCNRAEDAQRPQTVQLWDVAAGKELRQLRSPADPGAVTAAAFSPDGKTLVTASNDSTLTLWDVAAGKPVARFAGRSGLGAFVGFSPDGKSLAAAGQGGWVQCWDVSTGRRQGLYQGPAALQVQAGFTAAGRLLAWSIHGQSVTLWDVRAGKSLSPADGHSTNVTGLAFLDRGRGLVSTGSDGLICFWDPRTGTETHRLQLTDENYPRYAVANRFTSVTVSPDGRYLLTGGGGAALALRELATGHEVCALPGFTAYPMGSAAFAPNGRLVATAGMVINGQNRVPLLRLWDVDTGRELHQLQAEQGDLRGLAFSPDNRTVAALAQYFDRVAGNGSVAEITAWQVDDGKKLFQVKAENANAQALAFSPDGTLLALTCAGRGISLRDAATGKERRLFQPAVNVGWTTPPVFSPDGKTIAVGAQHYDRPPQGHPTVQLWEVASGGLRRELEGHLGPVTCLAFAPDGATLATAGGDTTVLLWDVPGPPAAGRPGADLEAQWARLAGGDAAAAYDALRRLVAAPAEAVPLLRKHVRPVRGPAADAATVARWITELDDDEFAVRTRAAGELARLGKAAEEPLRQALHNQPSAEARRQIERLLERLDPAQPSAEELAGLRAVEVLERLATPEARRLLEELAHGAADALLTQDAGAALERLTRRPAGP